MVDMHWNRDRLVCRILVDNVWDSLSSGRQLHRGLAGWIGCGTTSLPMQLPLLNVDDAPQKVGVVLFELEVTYFTREGF